MHNGLARENSRSLAHERGIDSRKRFIYDFILYNIYIFLACVSIPSRAKPGVCTHTHMCVLSYNACYTNIYTYTSTYSHTCERTHIFLHSAPNPPNATQPQTTTTTTNSPTHASSVRPSTPSPLTHTHTPITNMTRAQSSLRAKQRRRRRRRHPRPRRRRRQKNGILACLKSYDRAVAPHSIVSISTQPWPTPPGEASAARARRTVHRSTVRARQRRGHTFINLATRRVTKVRECVRACQRICTCNIYLCTA